MLLPTWGWIDDNSDGEDDEAAVTAQPGPAARLALAGDAPARRATRRGAHSPAQRPERGQAHPDPVFPLDEAGIEDLAVTSSTTFAALRQVAVRHQHALERMRNTRQMMFSSNFGICRFESKDDQVTAVGEVYTQAIDPDTQLPVMVPYMVHKAPLGPLTEIRPNGCADLASSGRCPCRESTP